MGNKKILTLLFDLGVRPNYKGYEYLVEAVKLCVDDGSYLTNAVGMYKEIAKNCNAKSWGAVERCMRTCLEGSRKCYNQKIFGETIPNYMFMKRIPNMMFVSSCVEKLKIKGVK